jgi:ABC-type multidrug transport system permease subunit
MPLPPVQLTNIQGPVDLLHSLRLKLKLVVSSLVNTFKSNEAIVTLKEQNKSQNKSLELDISGESFFFFWIFLFCFFCFFVCLFVCLFETGFHCAVLAVLELTL